MFISNKNQIITRHKQPTRKKGSAYSNYCALREAQTKEIKSILKDNPDIEIYYGRRWIKINGVVYNGYSREDIENMKGEI